MIAITTSNSISVNPLRRGERHDGFFMDSFLGE